MSEHTPSIPLVVDSLNWGHFYPPSHAYCMICSASLGIVYISQNYYTCPECGYESLEYSTDI